MIKIKGLSKQFPNETAIDYKDIVFEDGKSGLISANAAGAGALYAVVSEDIGSPVSDGIKVDGEISDFLCYEEILRKHGLI